MKNKLFYRHLIILLFVFCPLTFCPIHSIGAMDAPSNPALQSQNVVDSLPASLNPNKQKLSFTEKAALFFMKKKMKKHAQPKPKQATEPGIRDGFATASFVLGLLSLLLLGLFPVGTLCAILGLIFGIISLRRLKYAPSYTMGRGLAIAGIVLSGLSLLILFAFIAIILVILL